MCSTKKIKMDLSVGTILKKIVELKKGLVQAANIYLIMLLSGCLLQCDHYRRGIISGSSCKALCDQRTLRLQHCMSTSSTHQAKPRIPSQFRSILACVPDVFCRPITAGVQWSLEGQACCDQVWC